jgi:ABC-type amino acid transport substrate-binding protein
MEDLKKFNIIIYIGSSFQESRYNGWTNVTLVKDLPTVVRLIGSARADLIIEVAEIIKYAAKKELVADKILYREVNFVPNTVQDYSIAIRKSFPDAEALIGQIGKAQEELRAGGVIKRIIDSYG